MATSATTFTPQPTLPNPARAPEVLNLLLRLVNLSLSLGLNDTALFIAERYSCLCPLSEEAIFLHALSLLRCNEHRQALELLKSTIVEPPPLLSYPAGNAATAAASTSNSTTRRPACEASVRCAWVYAEACIALGRANEGGECLKRAFMIYGNDKLSMPDYATFTKPTASSASTSSVCVHLTLAKLAARANKTDVAVQRYQEALRSAWWCWEAYEGLCSLGKAPDADEMFAPITVPTVQDPIDKQQDPPAASFLAAPPMDTRHSTRRSGSSQGGNNKPAHLPTSLHITTEQRSNSVSSQSSFFRTSTPSFQFDNGQPFFGAGKSHAGAATSTPVESQGAAFRFGEADVRGDEDDDHRARARSREPSAGPRLSTSIDEGAGTADESSFWNPGAVRKARAQGTAGNGGGGLFGFAASAKSAPLFGQGLLFGQNGGSKQEGSRSASMSAGSGGFFTPVNVQNGIKTPDAAAAPATSKFINGRQAPAAKRSINQIDESAPDDSFHFQSQAQQRRQQQGTIPNGMTGQISGDVEQILIDDAEDGPQNGASSAASAARPTYARKNSHLMMEKLGRGVNGNHAPLDTSIAGGNFAAKANRIVSNPREKKRSRAGPSNFDDASTTTASSSHSVDTNGALYHASSSSSSPPAGQSENDPHGYALPSIAGRQTASGETHSARPVTTPAFHKSAPAASATANLAVSQPLLPAPSAEREMSYKKQLEAAQNALAENWLRSIFRLFAKAQSCMSKYECSEAIKAVLSLPKEQRNSTRAILLLGEASFESLEYAKAEKAFSTVRSLSPFHTAGMEIYSTLLWHLHRPTHLSYLAQDLLEISPTLPQAWIATGNVFSHLEDHPNALKCFKRAIQCDESFTYAYTLAGHESVTMEEWDVAIGFFREAIRKQPRHYNAWFGLGNVYMKTGKFRMAEYHFRKAVEINPSNAMLVCCVGTVLEKLDKKKEALEMYERACLLAPTSPAVRFKRVRMLMELRHFDSALRDLMLVRDMAPDEFNVHYLLGKLYGAMGDKINMTRNLTIAQDLEPRAAGRIREIIENAGKLDEEEEEEGEGQGKCEDDGRTDAGDNEDMQDEGENDSRDADMA